MLVFRNLILNLVIIAEINYLTILALIIMFVYTLTVDYRKQILTSTLQAFKLTLLMAKLHSITPTININET